MGIFEPNTPSTPPQPHPHPYQVLEKVETLNVQGETQCPINWVCYLAMLFGIKFLVFGIFYLVYCIGYLEYSI